MKQLQNIYAIIEVGLELGAALPQLVLPLTQNIPSLELEEEF